MSEQIIEVKGPEASPTMTIEVALGASAVNHSIESA